MSDVVSCRLMELQINCINIDGCCSVSSPLIGMNWIYLVIIEFKTQIGDNVLLMKFTGI